MRLKRSGLVDDSGNDLQEWGVLELFYPSVFLGIELNYEEFPKTATFHYTNRQDAEEEIGAALKDGQFVIQHQFGGTSCAKTLPFGIFCPLNRDEYPIQQLRAAISSLKPPSIDSFPDPASEEVWAKAMAAIGPLRLVPGKRGPERHIRSNETGAHEAFVRFSDLDNLYPWLREHFQYVTEISGMDANEIRAAFLEATGVEIDPTRWWTEQDKLAAAMIRDDQRPSFFAPHDRARQRQVTGLSRLPWHGIAEFGQWLAVGLGGGRVKRKVTPGDLTAALIWQNSD